MGNETAWMGEYRSLVERIIFLCNRSAIHFTRPADFQIEHRLTAIQIQIIEYLLEDDSQKMSTVANRLGITRGAFSNNVTKLSALGLVTKEHKEGNNKELFVKVTPKGREEYLQYAEFIYNHAFKQIFAIADTLPKDAVKSFEEMLKHFADTLV